MKRILCGLFITCLLFAGLADAADGWTQQFPDPRPPARGYHVMAYMGGDQVLLFGGYDGSGFADTWVYDLSLNTWTRKFPDPHPSDRNRHGMAYIGGDQVLLFGGYYYSDETWLYDFSEGTWTEITPPTKPSARYGQEMAYIGGDQVLMFGGWDGGHLDETWVFDLSESTWTQMNPPIKPAAREYFGMAYIGGDQVLVFGGWWFIDDETWLYDLSENTWTLMEPPIKPSVRHWHAMAYIGGDQALLFGGNDGAYDDETWVYDLSESTWTQMTPSIKPSARGYHDMAYLGGGQVLLFGGYNGSYDDETWIYNVEPEAPLVTLTSPNGGEVLADSVTITWTATDPDPGETALLMVDLDYSADAGSTWSVIDSSQANDGAYFWDISGLSDGDNYLVRVTATDTSGLSDSDSSDSLFTIDNPDPPAAITDLMATLADSTIHLGWTAITEDTVGSPIIVEHYTIYRNPDPDFSPAPADSIGSTADTFYIDPTPALKDTSINHYYVVRAVDSQGRKSEDSNRVGEFDRNLITIP